jgi:hypothetical protein
VLKPLTAPEVLEAYKFAMTQDQSVMIIETRDLYDEEF